MYETHKPDKNGTFRRFKQLHLIFSMGDAYINFAKWERKWAYGYTWRLDTSSGFAGTEGPNTGIITDTKSGAILKAAKAIIAGLKTVDCPGGEMRDKRQARRMVQNMERFIVQYKDDKNIGNKTWEETDEENDPIEPMVSAKDTNKTKLVIEATDPELRKQLNALNKKNNGGETMKKQKKKAACVTCGDRGYTNDGEPCKACDGTMIKAGPAPDMKKSEAKVKQGAFENVSVKYLFPSATNPRKKFDENDLKDLAASIKDKGVLQPLLIRVCKKEDDRTLYEIISGERRFRAAQLAGLDEVPCIHMQLTDQQVIEVQVIENMQRTDLTPLEEAVGYKELHENYGYDWPDLAVKIGKSKGYIFTRLRLLKLIPDLQKMLTDGRLKLSWAEAVTVLDQPEDQEKLYNDMVKQQMAEYWDFDDFKDHIKDNYLLQLAKAPFPLKDTSLQGGACGSCATRTGAQPDLFGELTGKEDTCQNPQCWAAKKKEYEKNLLNEYSKFEKFGHKVIVGAAAEKALSGCAYEKPGGTHYMLKGNTTWEQALKGTEYKQVIIVDAKGKAHRCISPKAAIEFVPAKYRNVNSTPTKSKTPEEKALEEAQGQADELAEQEIMAVLAVKAENLKMESVDTLKFLREVFGNNNNWYSGNQIANFFRVSKEPKTPKHYKRNLIATAYDNYREETLTFFGLKKEFEALKKKKLTEIRAKLKTEGPVRLNSSEG